MDVQSFTERIHHLLRQYYLPVLFFFIGLICLIYGLIVYFGPSQAAPDIAFETLPDASRNTTEKDLSITVDIAGAVIRPGVYSLTREARVQDAVKAAGGFAKDADTTWIARQMNLAQRASDGLKIYIPFLGEEGNVLASVTKSGDTSISINTASSSLLEELPGVGTVTAANIIENRPYSSVEELVSKKVISQSVFEKIVDKISL